MKKYILVIDEGTTGTRALIYDKNFAIVSQSYTEFTQYTPAEDRVEHDAMEIYAKSIEMCKIAIDKAGINPEEIASIGITNQRATCVIWDKITGQPLYNAIVWQDSRTGHACEAIKATDMGEKARKATGWTVAPVYSSMSIQWMMQNVPAVQEAIEKGTAIVGTIDTWLIWNLTGRATHAVSYSNATIMGCYDLTKLEWYQEFLDYLGIPNSILPDVIDDSGDYGCTYESLFGAAIPINGVIADQHAALFAQGCRTGGTGKITNGTGSFIDVNVGTHPVISDEGLNTVIAWKIGDTTTYALEGYEAVTGSAVQWLRDGLKIIDASPETEELARSVPDSNGVIMVPALTGLEAPFHDPLARGAIFGITRGTTIAHIARATLEGVTYRLKDILDAVERESGVKMNDLRIDGGLSMNNFAAQDMADMLNAHIGRPGSVEATALGAAQMAGLYCGFWTTEDLEGALEIEHTFEPSITDEVRNKRYSKWSSVIKGTMGYAAK